MSDAFHVEGADVVFRSHIFDVERRRVRGPSGPFNRDVAVHPGAVAVLVIDDRERIGLIRQYRSTFDRELLEVPAGTQDVAGEDPLATAKRELAEELGVAAATWTLLGRFMNSPGWTNQVMTIYEARDLHEVARSPAGPEESASSVEWLTKEELRARLRAAPAIDSTTAVALHRVFGSFLDDD